MKTIEDEVRKGPWTEQEDILLINFVHMFGDRRWDFIAKVSGLKVAGDKPNRTGKSCRLRWVNYLHPGLKRGKMSPQEEKLVLELHAKWGNRWSRIARKLPGRTDNEIKNYWRSHMRKMAQDKKRVMFPTSASSNCSSSITTTKNPSSPFPQLGEASFYDTGGVESIARAEKINEVTQGAEEEHSMDEIWNDLETTTIELVCDRFFEQECKFNHLPMASPSWKYFPDTLWKIEEEDSKMFFPFEYGTACLTG